MNDKCLSGFDMECTVDCKWYDGCPDRQQLVKADESNKNLIHYVADFSKGFAVGRNAGIDAAIGELSLCKKREYRTIDIQTAIDILKLPKKGE
jgi:hypothetical protein